ncbi:MAG: hypothetical protein HC889_19340 [Synechococcaceae cyanobacterium SM1_2_3]|nr:hypothetical protein [Synechococcaceae cyanobacterium SM1_2_3]
MTVTNVTALEEEADTDTEAEAEADADTEAEKAFVSKNGEQFQKGA